MQAGSGQVSRSALEIDAVRSDIDAGGVVSSPGCVVAVGLGVGAGLPVGTGTEVAVGTGEGIRVGRDVVVAVGEGRSVETSDRGDGVRVDLRLGTEVEVVIASMVEVATRTWSGLGSIVAVEQATPRIVARIARPFPIFIR